MSSLILRAVSRLLENPRGRTQDTRAPEDERNERSPSGARATRGYSRL